MKAYLYCLLIPLIGVAADDTAPQPGTIVPPPGGMIPFETVQPGVPIPSDATTISLDGAKDRNIDDKRDGSVKAPGQDEPKKRLTPLGTWRWTTHSRNLMPIENSLTLVEDKKGRITGKLIDRYGERDVQNVTITEDAIAFQMVVRGRNVGDLIHTYTINLDAETPEVTVETPDFGPLGKQNNGKRREALKVKKD